jgi:hypothetical protein
MVESGDPGSGPSLILMRFAPGCSVPWHWHTPNEHAMVVSGALQIQMKGDPAPVTLGPGDYALAPAKHAHQAKSTGRTTIFLSSDGPFDIHYVDASGNEIPADQVVKAAPAKAPAKASKPPAKPKTP